MPRSRRYLFAFVAALLLLALMAPISQRIEAESSDQGAPATEQPAEVVVAPSDQAAIATEDEPVEVTEPADVETDAPPAGETTSEEPIDAPAEVVTEVPTDAPAEVPTEEPAEVPTEAAPGDEPAEQPAETATEAPTEEAKVSSQAATGSLVVTMSNPGSCVEVDATSGGPGANMVDRACDSADGASDGAVHFDDLPPATYWVAGYSPSAHGFNYGIDRVTITAGKTSSVSMYPRVSTLTVHLTDVDSGAAISTVPFDIVQLFADGTELVYSLERTSRPSDIEIEINPGTYRIVTNQTSGAVTYPATSSAPFTLALSESRTIDLSLKGGAPAGRAPECWAERWNNADNGYKLDCDYYVPGETVNVYLDHTNTKPIASFVANYKGSGTVWVSVMHAVGGQHKIVWQGSQTTKKLTKPIDVPQIVTLSVDRGISGTIVTIYGSGFGRNEQVTISWGPWNKDSYALKTVTSRRNGDVVAKIKIPKGDPKVMNSINLIAPSGNATSAGFEVIPRPKKSTVSRVTSAIKEINVPGI